MKTQQEDETSPLAVAIVRALDPWPGSHYEAYALVDDLLGPVRSQLQVLQGIRGRVGAQEKEND